MNARHHPQESPLSNLSTLKDSSTLNDNAKNTANSDVESGGRVDRVQRVDSAVSPLLAGLFGDSSTLRTKAKPAENIDNAATGPTCHHCGSNDLFDSGDPPGIRCDACGMLVWIVKGESLLRVGWHDHDVESMAPDDLPECETCGELCDTQTHNDAWHCSRCESAVSERAASTRQMIGAAILLTLLNELMKLIESQKTQS